MNSVQDTEPTPEFYARGQDIFRRWESGDLPFKDAVDQMTVLGREAGLANHCANQGRAELLLGIMQGYRANLDASISHFDRARDLFERAGNRRRAISCVLNLGESYRLKGNFTRARQLFRAAFDGAKDIGVIDTQTIAACNEGQMLLSMDHLESARSTLEKAFLLAGQITERPEQRVQLLCETQAVLALAHLRLKQNEKAWYFAWEALKIAREIDQPLYVGHANRSMGEVLSALGALPADADPSLSDDPDEYFRASSEAFQEIKAEGEQARTMYAHALSLAARGKGMTAARKLQQAMIIFTRLGMADDAAKAAHAQMEVLANTSPSGT
jgi:tetratricopeptide (TPR) repeat protein